MVTPGVDAYTKTPNQRKIIRKTQKERQPTKTQLKEYYDRNKLSGGLVFTFVWPGESNRPSSLPGESNRPSSPGAREKNAESCQSRLRHSGSVVTSALECFRSRLRLKGYRSRGHAYCLETLITAKIWVSATSVIGSVFVCCFCM